MTFRESDRIHNAGSPCPPLFQRQVSHHRIEIDRMSAAAEGIATVKVDILPSDRRDFFEKGSALEFFLVVGYLSLDKRGLHQPVKALNPASRKFRRFGLTTPKSDILPGCRASPAA
jgi:hypothetical protein